jgi:hypothetical protein
MNKEKLPSIVPILILTLITVVMWVSFDIYRAFLKPADVNVPAAVSQPLTPTLDQNVINQLESKPYLDNSQIPDTVVNSAPVATAEPSPSPQALPTALPVEATGSGVVP